MTQEAQSGYKLPDITISSSDKDQFFDDLHMLDKIANQFGEDISGLFGEICLIYGIKNEQDLKTPHKALMQGICQSILKQLALTMDEIDKLRAKYGALECFDLKGDDYTLCFNLLHNLRERYMSLIEIISAKRYLSEDYIKAVHERLSFLICTGFENLRKRFKVVETLTALDDQQTQESNVIPFTLH